MSPSFIVLCVGVATMWALPGVMALVGRHYTRQIKEAGEGIERRLAMGEREAMAAEMDRTACLTRLGADRATTPEAATHFWALAELMEDFAGQLRDASSSLTDTQKLRERFKQLTSERP